MITLLAFYLEILDTKKNKSWDDLNRAIYIGTFFLDLAIIFLVFQVFSLGRELNEPI